MLIVSWEDRWNSFRLGEAKTGTSLENVEYSEEDLKRIYQVIPINLFHVASPTGYRGIQKKGYLGFEYKSHISDEGSKWGTGDYKRSFQPAGYGVYLAFNPDWISILSNKALTQIQNNFGKYYLFTVPKSCLDPEKIRIDFDNLKDHGDKIRSLKQGTEIDPVLWVKRAESIFYLDKIPLSAVNVVEKNCFKEKSYIAPWQLGPFNGWEDDEN